ncbi:unnamed protein product [Blepharisma stoltei]|uniref:Actin n=1 Tax=Blepharisma stoltei TaxID=1481888 RepID=A0AAU9JFB2_9CILI|nr:unnamed protein product [Blepharisma stoltei]
MEGEDVHGLVIDNGSGICKAGFAGDDMPRSIFPSVVGRTRMPGMQIGIDQKDSYAGEEARQKCDILSLKSPIKRGIITDWDDMEKIWHHTFYNELRVAPDLHPLLMTEIALNPQNVREKITQIIFEVFSIPAFYLASQPALSLYSSGKITGLVVDSGDSITSAVPIYEGYVLPYAIKTVNFGGKDLTEFFINLLRKKGYNLNTSAEKEFARDIKERICYASANYSEELKVFESTPGISYKMPDGSSLSISSERITCPESVFNPSLMNIDKNGIHLIAHKAILKSDEEIRDEMYQNIMICGGNTLFSGLPNRFTQEISNLLGNPEKIKVFAPPERLTSAWIGGSILASLSTFNLMWITKSEYEESGSQIIHKKCY